MTSDIQQRTGQGTLVGVFDDRHAAETCVRRLHEAGYGDDRIGFLSRSGEAGHVAGEGTEHAEPKGGLAGAASGSVAGGVAGGILGALVTALIPGIGPVVAAGILSGVVAGAPTGAVLGGIAGALRGAGVPEEDAGRYDDEFQHGRTLVTVRDGDDGRATEIIRGSGGRLEGGISRAVSGATGTRPPDDQPSDRMPLHEERLEPTTRPVPTGEASVTKDVVTERRDVEVPVTREEVVVEQHDVEDRPARPGHQFGSGEIRTPVTEDQVALERRPVVTGEVELHKRQVEETRTVSGDVRREVPRVERADAEDLES